MRLLKLPLDFSGYRHSYVTKGADYPRLRVGARQCCSRPSGIAVGVGTMAAADAYSLCNRGGVDVAEGQ